METNCPTCFTVNEKKITLLYQKLENNYLKGF
jgi:hypothetical protein